MKATRQSLGSHTSRWGIYLLLHPTKPTQDTGDRIWLFRQGPNPRSAGAELVRRTAHSGASAPVCRCRGGDATQHGHATPPPPPTPAHTCTRRSTAAQKPQARSLRRPVRRDHPSWLYLNSTKPNHLEKHPPPFEATHPSSDIHGDVNKKGKSTRFPTKKTR
jgi:hypothetical protein